MNIAYIYLQIYRLFDDAHPLPGDCGKLCGKACCSGDDAGMYLFPGEESVFRLLNPSWANIEKSDFTYCFGGREKNVPIIFCSGDCDRYQRPLACRIFPLTPYLSENGRLEIIIDPRAKSVCPLPYKLDICDFNSRFVKNIRRAFLLLMKNDEIKEYLIRYSEYIDEYRKFFKE